jgi:hypothetical protein
VSWSVSVDSTAEATAHQLSGVVTSGDAASLISPQLPENGVLVAIQAQPAFLNDTTNANLNRNGFLLNHLPCVPPVAINTTVPWKKMAWQLTLELRLSPTLYETVRFMKQGPMELAISFFTTVMAVMGVWKTIFSFMEGPVSALRKRLTRRRQSRRQIPREQQPSGVELQPNDRMVLLASVVSNSKPDASAALAAVKELRREHQAAEDELHEKNKQQDLVIVQMTKKHDEMTKKQDEVIRQLSLIQEQLKVAVNTTASGCPTNR